MPLIVPDIKFYDFICIQNGRFLQILDTFPKMKFKVKQFHSLKNHLGKRFQYLLSRVCSNWSNARHAIFSTRRIASPGNAFSTLGALFSAFYCVSCKVWYLLSYLLYVACPVLLFDLLVQICFRCFTIAVIKVKWFSRTSSGSLFLRQRWALFIIYISTGKPQQARHGSFLLTSYIKSILAVTQPSTI